MANVLSVAALFVALGGTGYAAGILPPNSVGTAQLKADAVTGAKVKDRTLEATDFAPGQLKPGPAGTAGTTGVPGPTGPAGGLDSARFYPTAEANARFVGGALVSVVASSGDVISGQFGTATATCPTGYQAIAGGVESTDPAEMRLTESEPLVQGSNLSGLPEGPHEPPSAWRGRMRNNLADPEGFKVAAICAPVG